MADAILAAGLTRRFGQADPVVDGVDLAVRRSEVLGLIGPNGGGKSTLLLLMAGLLRPTSGTVTVLGQPAHALARDAAGTVGLLTPHPGLYPALTVRENLAFFAGLYGRRVDDAALGIADSHGLTPHLDRRAGLLSSGQQQKVSLVRALLLDPAVLLFDEPTANLDPSSAYALHVQLRAQAEAGRAVVLCTHDLHAASQVCDRVAILHRTLREVRVLEGERRPPEPSVLHAAFEAAL